MKSLTVAYITSRREPKIEWFFSSLSSRVQSRAIGETAYQIIVVDSLKDQRDQAFRELLHANRAWHVTPKPTVWQGAHRLTKEDWWAKSNALNTAICLSNLEWIAFVDDRSVLAPGWLNSIADAMAGDYAVCGRYEKHLNLEVVNGEVTNPGTTDSVDHRRDLPEPQPTRDWYGGHGALPLEWCLQVNAFSEDLCDSLGLEDCMFGVTLNNNGLPICYDARMKIIEDRTQGEIDGALKRTDKGISPDDKSHAIVARFQGATTSMNSFDIREVRNRVQAGEPFPPPSASDRDWFDGQLLSEFA